MFDYELLELLLTFAVPRRDVKPLARQLLERFRGLGGVLHAGLEELEAVEGMGPVSATIVRLVHELCVACLEEKMMGSDFLSSPQAVRKYARVILGGMSNEAFMVICLNVRNQVMHTEILQEGTVDRAMVFPRRIIETALFRHAAGIILVHNHPSGQPEPSDEDRRLTATVVAAARTVGLRVLDHLVVGRDSYFSFAEADLMPG